MQVNHVKNVAAAVYILSCREFRGMETLFSLWQVLPARRTDASMDGGNIQQPSS
jgi:hypothetical protein